MKYFVRTYSPEIVLVILTLIISLVLTNNAGVGYYFCIRELLTIMGKPLFFYCLPCISLAMLSLKCVEGEKGKNGNDAQKLFSKIKREAHGLFIKDGIVSSSLVFFLLLWLLGIFYTCISNIKPLILLYNPRIWDKELMLADTFLLGGFDWCDWLSRFHSPFLNRIMNMFYLSLFPMFGITMAILLLMRDTVSMRRLVLCLMVLTLIGNLWHFLMPSLGDVYIHPERYRDINGVYVKTIQKFLYMKQREIIISQDTFHTAPFIGIAAIPSLHIAKFLVYILIIKKYSKLLLGGYIVTFLGLFFSTLYFGWHYIIDAIAGVLIAVPIYFLVVWYVNEKNYRKSIKLS